MRILEKCIWNRKKRESYLAPTHVCLQLQLRRQHWVNWRDVWVDWLKSSIRMTHDYHLVLQHRKIPLHDKLGLQAQVRLLTRCFEFFWYLKINSSMHFLRWLMIVWKWQLTDMIHRSCAKFGKKLFGSKHFEIFNDKRP